MALNTEGALSYDKLIEMPITSILNLLKAMGEVIEYINQKKSQ